jgi:hypothetical protein
MTRGSASSWRCLLFSTAWSALQARALIGASTSRLVGPRLTRVGSVDTALILYRSGDR